MDEMLKDFLVEALDLSSNVEDLLLTLEKDTSDAETLNAIFRAFHTIKGGAGFMSLPAVVTACHLTENLFDALRTGAVVVTPATIALSLEANNFVEDQLASLLSGATVQQLPAMPSKLEHALTAAINGTGEQPRRSSQKSTPASFELFEDRGEPEIAWASYYNAIVPSQAQIAAGPPESPGQGESKAWDGVNDRRAAVQVRDDTIRIDSGKLDALLEVAGESVQAANQASVLLEKIFEHNFEGKVAELMASLQETLGRASRYATELQRASLATRMQPVGRLFQKFPRLVRELSKELDKDVELEVEGADTEVDRVVVDSLYDPLVHMLRNSLDHGIEDKHERTLSGKRARSKILLKSWQAGNNVMLVISDDGRGMNAQALIDKAKNKKLIPGDVVLSENEAFQLVFLPGFSTKEIASSVSGRGVGMDVVKTAVEKHRGTIQIESILGQGTKFIICLPIELSIVPTMLVNTAGALLGLPMGAVTRVIELPPSFQGVGGSPVLMDQGRPLPVRSLAAILGYQPAEEAVGIVISSDKPYILAVSHVEGTADLVIKPLTALAAPGISGTARSAEGQLVLIVGTAFLDRGCKIA